METTTQKTQVVMDAKSNPVIIEPKRVCSKCGRELPLMQFRKNRAGEPGNICKECFGKLVTDGRKNAEIERKKKLVEEKNSNRTRLEALRSDYTPLELIRELKRRGYQGKLKFVEVHVIDLENIVV